MERAVVALFDEMSAAQNAVQELVNHGFDRNDISVVASDRSAVRSGDDVVVDTTVETADGAAAGAGIGAVLGGLAGLLVGIGALAIPGIGPIIAAGPLAAALAGAGLGAATGGVIGALADAGVPEEQARYYEEGVRRGGVLVTVRAAEGMTSQAMDILNRYGPVDINRRVESWRESGWDGNVDDSDRGPYRDTGYTATTATGYGGSAAFGSDDPATSGRRGSTTGGASALDDGLGGTGYVETQHTGTGSGATGTGTGNLGSGAGYSGTNRDTRSNDVRDASASGSTSRTPVGSAGSDLGTGGGSYTGNSGTIDTANRGTAGGTFTGDDGDRTSYGTGTGGTVEGGSGVGRYTESSLGMSTSGSYPGIRQGELGALRNFFAEEPYFRQDYQRRYAQTGLGYDRYQPAYRYGYELHNNDHYADRDWSAIEQNVRREWEQSHPDDAWEDFKDSVRHGWERFKEGVRETFDFDDDYFRKDYERQYAGRGYGYEYYQPAYRYGHELANDERYRGRDWYDIETRARHDWAERYPDSAWDDFADAVRQGWNRVRTGVSDALDPNR